MVKTSTTTPNPTRWLKLVELIEFMWENWSLPTKQVGRVGTNSKGLRKYLRDRAVGGHVEGGGGGDRYPN